MKIHIFGEEISFQLENTFEIRLYNLETGVGETEDITEHYPDLVRKMEKIMQDAITPSDCYPIGEIYNGDPIWRKMK